MKKNIKFLISGIFIIAVAGSFIGCNNSDKALAKGKELINEKQYEKAVASLELALDDNPKNKDAKELKEMVEDYLEAEKAFKSGQINKAEVKIEAIGNKDEAYASFKESVDNLAKNIVEKDEYDKDIARDMEKLNQFIDNKNYVDALLLAKSLDGRQISEAQREEFYKLKMKLTSNVSIESTDK